MKTIWRDGREYLTVPASLIVPGVLSGSSGDLYYPPNEVSRNPSWWNSIPVTMYHPTDNSGKPLSATANGVKHYGWLENATYDRRLKARAWLDVEKLKTHPEGPWVINELKAGRKVELSTGLFTENDHKPGTDPATGRTYTHVARDYRPDHLAILPRQKGACSLTDGCGFNVNAEGGGQCSACASGMPCTGVKRKKKKYKGVSMGVTNAGANCGIGSGGFAKGNKCAAGGGGGGGKSAAILSSKANKSSQRADADNTAKAHLDASVAHDKAAAAAKKAGDKSGHANHQSRSEHHSSRAYMRMRVEAGMKTANPPAPKVDKSKLKEQRRREKEARAKLKKGGLKPLDYEISFNKGGDPVTGLKKKLVRFLTANCPIWKGQEKVLNGMEDMQLMKLKKQHSKAQQAEEVLSTVKDTLKLEDLSVNTLGEALKKATAKPAADATQKTKVVANANGYKPAKKIKGVDDDDDDDDDDEKPKGKKPVANEMEDEYKYVVEKARQELANRIVSNIDYATEEARQEEYTELLSLPTKTLEKKLSRLKAKTATANKKQQLDDEVPPGYRPSYAGAGGGNDSDANPVANMAPMEDVADEMDWQSMSAFNRDD